MPITGIWQEKSPKYEDINDEKTAKESLAIPTRTPMSICIDHQQAVIGCADGT